jgi:hypothetical protein
MTRASRRARRESRSRRPRRGGSMLHGRWSPSRSVVDATCCAPRCGRHERIAMESSHVIHFFVVTDRFLAGGGCRPRSVGRGVFLSSPDTPHPVSVRVVYMCVNLQIDSGNINTKGSVTSWRRTHPKVRCRSLHASLPYMTLEATSEVAKNPPLGFLCPLICTPSGSSMPICLRWKDVSHG